jgi:dUTPase
LLQANGFGVIDRAYIGPLLIRYKYIFSPNDCIFFTTDQWPSFGIKIDLNKIYKVGDKIGQIIVTEQHRVREIPALELNETDRGGNGFGSSGQ